MPRPLRSSCDRCHSQKLKCPKQLGSTTCTRCLKAGAACIFSPAGPAWRRSSANIACQSDALLLSNSEVDGSFQFDLSWPPLLNAGEVSATNPDYITPPVSDPEPKTAPQDHRSICVRQLSSLAVEIDNLASELESTGGTHLPKEIDPEDLYSQHISHVSYSRYIEQLFNSAQRLIDLYPDVLTLLSKEDSSSLREECQDSNCFHSSDVSGDFAAIFSEADPIPSRVDMFLFHLLAACHGKISDVLDWLVKTTKLCAQVTSASPDLIQPRLHIPELRVGSFVASATSASSMQATLLVHITAVLMENTKSLRRRFEGLSKTADRPDKEIRVVLLQCELLEERSSLQAKQFVRIRDGLTKLAYIK
ncbi:hypothetical protein F4678DRAFT_317463 [Xylaria arbuscula]|nr:hypothetical protein F4678DRAFT_317463 [Xylaria arbuscula]